MYYRQPRLDPRISGRDWVCSLRCGGCAERGLDHPPGAPWRPISIPEYHGAPAFRRIGHHGGGVLDHSIDVRDSHLRSMRSSSASPTLLSNTHRTGRFIHARTVVVSAARFTISRSGRPSPFTSPPRPKSQNATGEVLSTSPEGSVTIT